MTDYNIKVNTHFNKDLIISEIEYPELYGQIQDKVQHIIKLQDEGVRKTLIALGWTPPKKAKP